MVETYFKYYDSVWHDRLTFNIGYSVFIHLGRGHVELDFSHGQLLNSIMFVYNIMASYIEMLLQIYIIIL